jgi:hypothetical protein
MHLRVDVGINIVEELFGALGIRRQRGALQEDRERLDKLLAPVLE